MPAQCLQQLSTVLPLHRRARRSGRFGILLQKVINCSICFQSLFEHADNCCRHCAWHCIFLSEKVGGGIVAPGTRYRN